MTAPDVHVGDKVRVTFTHDGIVAKNHYGLYIPSSMNGGLVYLDDPITGCPAVEVLERAVPKVGDVVKGTELDQLPKFSVVVTVGSTCVQQKTPGGKWWRAGISGTEIVYPTLDYRVLYVPEDGAA